MELKALVILKEGLDFMQKAVKVNPISADELNAEIEVYKAAIAELEALIEKDKSKKCEECCKETNKVLALVEQRESDAKNTIIKLIRELETLENQDKLAELEKVILDYYLGKGYQIGIGGWSFKVAIQTKYKNKKLLVYFKESELDKWNIWLRIDNEQTTKEMFNKAIKWFKTN